jgi:hypothetical protein
MASQFAPVELKTIKQGEFQKDAEHTFKKLQQTLLKHVDEFDVSTSAAMTIKVAIMFNRTTGAYTIMTSLDVKLPKIPPKIVNAIPSEDKQGNMCLFAQALGPTEKDPQQTLLCDDKGRDINLETGKRVNEED